MHIFILTHLVTVSTPPCPREWKSSILSVFAIYLFYFEAKEIYKDIDKIIMLITAMLLLYVNELQTYVCDIVMFQRGDVMKLPSAAIPITSVSPEDSPVLVILMPRSSSIVKGRHLTATWI